MGLYVVGLTAIEPVTSSVSRKRSPTELVAPTLRLAVLVEHRCVNAFRTRLVVSAAVGSVGFWDLRGWLSWLAMVAFGCGVAPMRPHDWPGVVSIPVPATISFDHPKVSTGTVPFHRASHV
jgi:hypothetical protein